MKNSEEAKSNMQMSTGTRVSEIEKMLLKYLEDKYGESFVCEKISGKSILSKTYNMSAYPKSSDTTELFAVVYNPEKNTISDGYYGVIVRSEIVQEITQVLEEIIGEHKLFVRLNSTYFLNELIQGVSKNEAESLGQNMRITLSVFTVNKPDAIEDALATVKQLGYGGIFQYYSLEDALDLDGIDDSNFINKISLIQSDKITVNANVSNSF